MFPFFILFLFKLRENYSHHWLSSSSKKRKLENNCLLRDVFLKIFFFFDWRSANDGFSLIAWRRFSFKRRSKRRLDRRLVSQELIVGLNKETIGTSVLVLMNAIVSKAHNSKLFEHLPMACPTFTWASARPEGQTSADIQAHVNTFSLKKMKRKRKK